MMVESALNDLKPTDAFKVINRSEPSNIIQQIAEQKIIFLSTDVPIISKAIG